ncbi:hypothetical protein DY000_02025840 [Brassica cretica]|uniref:Uncharacterized protein n=1 Tax=Brassica cretica TaxID=69181 RepID=A0ABQ7E3T4_BRACR|nr:hypothetical protein DY000_02025840 [Brassica cretica]
MRLKLTPGNKKQRKREKRLSEEEKMPKNFEERQIYCPQIDLFTEIYIRPPLASPHTIAPDSTSWPPPL